MIWNELVKLKRGSPSDKSSAKKSIYWIAIATNDSKENLNVFFKKHSNSQYNYELLKVIIISIKWC